MPEFIHNRAEHLLARNPDMKKSTAFAIATQQSHALGKSPKGYGTAAGKREARKKYDTPKDDERRANPGGLESPKLGSLLLKAAEERPSNWGALAGLGAGAAALGAGALALRRGRAPVSPSLLSSRGARSALSSGAGAAESGVRNVANSLAMAPTMAPQGGLRQSMIPTVRPVTPLGRSTPSGTRAATSGVVSKDRTLVSASNAPVPPVPLSDAQLLEHEANKVKGWMSRLTPEEVTALGNSSLVRAGMSPERAFQLAEVSRGTTPLSAFLKTASVGFLAELMEIIKEAHTLSAATSPQGRLARDQRVGTLDDPGGTKFKPLHMLKPPKPVQTVASGSSMVGGNLFSKTAFGLTGFGDTGGVWRPRYTSLVQPIGAPPVGTPDPQLKESGDKVRVIKKCAFSGSGFGATSQHGAYDGNGGYHASIVQPIGARPAGVPDPILRAMRLLKQGSSTSPEARLEQAQSVGAPKATPPAGPSIAQVSRPVGIGHVLPGAARNRI